MKTTNFAILINTCDTFDDCWNAFFSLWDKYGLSKDIPIYLNTERKIFEYPGLNIISTKVCESLPKTSSRPTWSWCLKNALLSIPEDNILYLQEDYFLHSKIDEDTFFKYLEAFMTSSADYLSIATTPSQCALCEKIGNSNLPAYKIKPTYTYLVSCQAAIWKKKSLLKLICDYESGWMFERWASRRARVAGYTMLAMECSDVQRIIPYVPTGIVKGKWYMPACEALKTHGINIDYNKRGYYNGTEYPKNISEVPEFVCRCFRYIWQTYLTPLGWLSVIKCIRERK